MKEGGWTRKEEKKKGRKISAPELSAALGEVSIDTRREKLLPTVNFLRGTVRGRDHQLLCHSSLCGATDGRVKEPILHFEQSLAMLDSRAWDRKDKVSNKSRWTPAFTPLRWVSIDCELFGFSVLLFKMLHNKLLGYIQCFGDVANMGRYGTRKAGKPS